MIVFGILPESQRLMSLPADLAYFNPALSLFLLPVLTLWGSHTGGKFELWQLQSGRSVSGGEQEEGTREREGKEGGRDWGRFMHTINRSIKQEDPPKKKEEIKTVVTALAWHSNAASCCLVTVRWEGNRKWSEMCWGDQQERQEVCFLWGEPRRKLSFSSVLICFLALRLSCFQNLWNWFREKWLSLTKESFYLPVQWFFPSVLSWLFIWSYFPAL